MRSEIPLTPDEIRLAKKFMAHGESALFSEGLSEADVRDFLNRSEIQYFLRTLYKDFEFKDSRRERMQYYALNELEKLIPQAISIVARSLIGMRPSSMDENADLPPSGQQYQAAVELLDRMKIRVTIDDAKTQENPVLSLNAVNVNIGDNVDSVSRERILTMVDMFLSGADEDTIKDKPSVSIKKLPLLDDMEEADDRLAGLKKRKKSDEKKATKTPKNDKNAVIPGRRPSGNNKRTKNSKKYRGNKPSKKIIPGTSTQK